MRHSVSWRLSLISLRLLLSSVSSHFTKKFPVLSHLMKIKSNFVSSHWKKIWFCLISWKKNLILSHLISQKSDFIPVLISCQVWTESFCFELISSHSDFMLKQNKIRTEYSDSDSQSKSKSKMKLQHNFNNSLF